MTADAVRAVLFDLDGTLADTARDLGGALNRLLAEENRPALALDRVRPYVSGGARALIGCGFGLKPDDAGYEGLRQRFLDHYETAICVDTVLFDGVAQLLEGLEQRGIAWGVVTNKSERFATSVIAALGLSARCSCLIGGDTATRPKPAPDPLLLACERIGITPANTLYVGDDLRDVQSGKAAGTGTVAAAWGYLGDELPIDRWQADWIIETPPDLFRLL